MRRAHEPKGADATIELRAADGLARPVLVAQEELGDALRLTRDWRRGRCNDGR